MGYSMSTMSRRLILMVALCTAMSLPSQAATMYISWTGANNYTMDGVFSYSSSLTGPITAADLTTFSINGYLNAGLIGSWDMASGTTSTFNFNFDATTLQFAVGGLTTSTSGQLWNAGPCPLVGFGFASGDAAQGFCLDGNAVLASAIPVSSSTLIASATPPVPEPATFFLVGMGLVAAGIVSRRRLQK